MQNISSLSAADTAVKQVSAQLSPDEKVSQDTSSVIKTSSAVDNETASAVQDVKTAQQSEIVDKAIMEKQKDKAEEKQELSDEELAAQREKAKELSDKLNMQNIGLSFSVDDNTSSTVINVTNRSTEDLVRQIPSEDMLRFQKIIADFEDKVKTADVNDEDSKAMLKGLILDEIV